MSKVQAKSLGDNRVQDLGSLNPKQGLGTEVSSLG